MKKVLALLLTLILIFALSACGKENTSSDTDTSAPISTTETTSEPADNSSEEDTDKETEGGTSNTGTPTESSKPTNNSKPTDTSKPDNSKPTETSKPTTSTTTPSTPTKPSEPEETKPTVKLPFDDWFYGGNALALTNKGTNGLTADRILNRSSYEIFHGYIYDNISTIKLKDWVYIIGNEHHIFSQYAVPEDVVYSMASNFFNINEATKTLLKQSERYDSNSKTYWIYDPSPFFTGDDATIEGYEDLGNGEYMLYVKATERNHTGPCSNCATTNSCVLSSPLFKAKIKATNDSKKYLVYSFEYISSIPSNITK